jgi:hypothetical protein
MTFFEYECLCDGYEIREAKEWDKIRTIGFFIFKSVGDKKSQSPRDIMQIPVLDGNYDRRDHLVRRFMEWKLKEQQKLEADAGSGVDSVKNTD